VTEAVARYRRLQELFGAPRSIPLGPKITHVSRTSTFEKWEDLRAEFGDLAQCMPENGSPGWYVLLLNIMNVMPWRQLEILARVTGRRWQRWKLDQVSLHATLETAANLRRRGLLA
jgi:hypothetical protein